MYVYVCMYLFNRSAPYSGGSTPSDKGGPDHPDPEIRGEGVSKKIFFGPSGLSLV